MSGRAIDLTGQDFGMLHVIKRAEGVSGSHAKWLCQCKNCGKMHVAQGRYLKSGEVQSCGCMKRGKKPGVMSDKELSASSDSLYRLQMDSSDPYQNLANAIVCVAADDYRNALKNDNAKLLESLTDFFYSDWYKKLSRIKPDALIKFLHREHDGNLAVAYIS